MARGQITRRPTLTLQEFADFLGITLMEAKAILGTESEVAQQTALKIRAMLSAA